MSAIPSLASQDPPTRVQDDALPPTARDPSEPAGFVGEYFQHRQYIDDVHQGRREVPAPEPNELGLGEEAFAVERLEPGDVVAPLNLEEALGMAPTRDTGARDRIMNAFGEGRTLVARARPRLDLHGTALTPFTPGGEVRVLAVSPTFVARAGGVPSDEVRSDDRIMSRRVVAAVALSGRFRASEISATFDLPTTLQPFSPEKTQTNIEADVLALASFSAPLRRGGRYALEGIWAFGTIPKTAKMQVTFSAPSYAGDPASAFLDEASSGLMYPSNVIPPRSGLLVDPRDFQLYLIVLCSISSNIAWQRFRTPVDLNILSRAVDERVAADPASLINPQIRMQRDVENATRQAVAERLGVSIESPQVDQAMSMPAGSQPASSSASSASRDPNSIDAERIAALLNPRPVYNSPTPGNATIPVPTGTLLFEVDRRIGAPSFLEERMAHSPLYSNTSIARMNRTYGGINDRYIVVSSGSLSQIKKFFTHKSVRAQVERDQRLRTASRPGETVVALTRTGDANPVKVNRASHLAGPAGPIEYVSTDQAPAPGSSEMIMNGITTTETKTTMKGRPVGTGVGSLLVPPSNPGYALANARADTGPIVEERAAAQGFPTFENASVNTGVPPGAPLPPPPPDSLVDVFLEEANSRVVEINRLIDDLGGPRYSDTEHVVVQVLSVVSWNWVSVNLMRLNSTSLIDELRERDLLDIGDVEPNIPEGELSLPDGFVGDDYDLSAESRGMADGDGRRTPEIPSSPVSEHGEPSTPEVPGSPQPGHARGHIESVDDVDDLPPARQVVPDSPPLLPPDSFIPSDSDTDTETDTTSGKRGKSSRDAWCATHEESVNSATTASSVTGSAGVSAETAEEDNADGVGTVQEYMEYEAERERLRVLFTNNSRILNRALRRCIPHVINAFISGGSYVTSTLNVAVDLSTSRVGNIAIIATVDPDSLQPALEGSGQGYKYSQNPVVSVPKLGVLQARAGPLKSPEIGTPGGDVIGALGPSPDVMAPAGSGVVRRRRAWRMVDAAFSTTMTGAMGYALLLPRERSEWYRNIGTLSEFMRSGTFQRAVVVAFRLSPILMSTPLFNENGKEVSRWLSDGAQGNHIKIMWARTLLWRLPWPFNPFNSPLPRLTILGDGSVGVSAVTHVVREEQGTMGYLNTITVLPGLLLKRGRVTGEVAERFAHFFRTSDLAVEEWAKSWDISKTSIYGTLNQSMTTVRLCQSTGRRLQSVFMQGAYAPLPRPGQPGALLNTGGVMVGSITASFGLRVRMDQRIEFFALPEVMIPVAQTRLAPNSLFYPDLSTYLFIADFTLEYPEVLGVVGARRRWFDNVPPYLPLLVGGPGNQEVVPGGHLVRVYWPGSRTPPGTFSTLRIGEVLCVNTASIAHSAVDVDEGRIISKGTVWLSPREALVRARLGTLRPIGVALSSRVVLVGTSLLPSIL